MKKILLTLLIILMLFLGVGLLFYPDISSWYNGRIHKGLTQIYNEEISRMREEYIEEHLRRAREHNLALKGEHIQDPFIAGSGAVVPSRADYLEILNIGGIMAQISIPAIDVRLPVFHTTSTEVLDRGVGHIEETSFPIGGQGTHAVLTAHSGLVHSRMFTDLEKIVIGDLFFITVLNKTLAYKVDQIIVVLPHEIEALKIARDADHVTLITCVPYSINTHRLLVRGTRVPYIPYMQNEIESITRTIDWRIVVIIIFSVLFLIIVLFHKVKNKKRRNTL